LAVGVAVVMPRRKAKLKWGLVNSAPKSTIEISAPDWSRIEKAYGTSVSGAAREAVQQAMQIYFMTVSVELTAETVKGATRKVKRVQRAGQDFVAAVIDMNVPQGSLVSSFVFRHFGRAEKLNLFFEMMESFTQACGAALKDIKNPRNHGAIRESSWKWWIRELTEIAKRNSLPSTVRKDSVTNLTDEPSQFVAFVRELQGYIPRPFQPPRRGDDALATAITRARATGQ
jgi:hypothetical protein